MRVPLPLARWQWQQLPCALPQPVSLEPGLVLLLDAHDRCKDQALACLSGHAPLSAGQLQCAGWDAQRDAEVYACHVCWVRPQQLQTLLLTALDWVHTQYAHWPLWDGLAWQQHVQGWQLGPHLHQPLAHLSTGTLRKLGLAVALASGARMTLLDTPRAGLDAASICYLVHALNDTVHAGPLAARWVLVADYEDLPGVQWSRVLTVPSL